MNFPERMILPQKQRSKGAFPRVDFRPRYQIFTPSSFGFPKILYLVTTPHHSLCTCLHAQQQKQFLISTVVVVGG